MRGIKNATIVYTVCDNKTCQVPVGLSHKIYSSHFWVLLTSRQNSMWRTVTLGANEIEDDTAYTQIAVTISTNDFRGVEIRLLKGCRMFFCLSQAMATKVLKIAAGHACSMKIETLHITGSLLEKLRVKFIANKRWNKKWVKDKWKIKKLETFFRNCPLRSIT